MRASNIFASLFTFFLPPAIIAPLILYLYPILFDCGFPYAKPAVVGCMIPGQQTDGIPAQIAPFRLLALADPQLEGDTSLPESNGVVFPSLANLWMNVREKGVGGLPASLSEAGRDFFTDDLYYIFQGYRKRLDLWGNDLYLAHIYRGVSWWSNPTHTVVLGDLLGSQHIGDEEFDRRSRRFWKSVFKGGEKVPGSVTGVTGRSEVLGHDKSWKNRIIAVAGNHDIGYAGDITQHRIDRFEETYGNVNWAMRFTLENDTTPSSSASWTPGFNSFNLAPSVPELRLVVLNSMNLDSPAKDLALQDQSRDFATYELHESAPSQSSKSATILLTHIPFHKEEGICVDGPSFDWLPNGGIKEQNHLSVDTTKHILNGLAKSGNAIVLNGHDHDGCHTYHYRQASSSTTSNEGQDPNAEEAADWQAKSYYYSASEIMDEAVTGIREITVRSMMGSFSGNAGFLSGWFDHDDQEWRFEYKSCALGVQHIWWGVHGFVLFDLGLGVAAIVAVTLEILAIRRKEAARRAGDKDKRE